MRKGSGDLFRFDQDVGPAVPRRPARGDVVASARHDVRGNSVREVVQAVNKGHDGSGGRRTSFLTDEVTRGQDVIKLVTDAKRGLKRNVRGLKGLTPGDNPPTPLGVEACRSPGAS